MKNIIKKHISFLMLIVLIIPSCNNSIDLAMTKDQLSLEDGMYKVERFGTLKSEILPLKANEKIIVFNQEFIDKTDQDKEYLVINTQEFAPLKLGEQPKTETQDDDRKRLLLKLSEKAKEQMKVFTAKNLNAHTAIVVNNEALTKHKIKSIIDEGLLQITRCTDNACELLYSELQDNVVKE